MTRWAVIGLVVATALFWAVPGLDLAVSGWFFDGAGFPVRSTSWIEAIRLTLYTAEDAAAVVTPVLGQGTAIGGGGVWWNGAVHPALADCRPMPEELFLRLG